MALTGWSGTNFLRRESAVLTAAPLTMAAWWYPVNNTNLQSILSLLNSTATDNRDQFKIGQANGSISFLVGDSAANSTASTTANSTLNAWNHICGVAASATDRRVFLNGGNKGTSVTSRTPNGIDRTSIGKQDNAANNKIVSNGAFIAFPAIWNIALSDAEVAALAVPGTLPTAIQPGALVVYWPLPGISATEIDIIGSNHLTVQGSLIAMGDPWNIGARLNTMGYGV